jgi:hypothetical protein
MLGTTCAASVSALYERMVTYRVLMVIALMTTWLVATGFATVLNSDRNSKIQSSVLAFTNLDTADGCQNEERSATVSPVSLQFCATLTSLFDTAAELPASWRPDEHSYRHSWVFLL